MGDALRVVLDARAGGAAIGGLRQTIIGLACGLSSLGGDDDYLFLSDGSDDWLRPYLAGRCALLTGRGTGGGPLRALARPLLRSGWVRRAVESSRLAASLPLSVPRSDGTIERAGADVMHFTFQDGFTTDVPSIYVPHDLQHLHLPAHFSRLGLRWRQTFYPALSRQARIVVALSEWGKRDLVERLAVPADKVRVVGWAPPVDAYPSPSAGQVLETTRTYGLPDAFALYPAQMFPHKNHLPLLEALRALRDRSGLEVSLVLCGAPTDHDRTVRRRVRALGLQRQVRLVGFVSPIELRCLYRLARLLVFPSRFEGFGLPVIEAFRAGVPVACANVTALPEVAGDAALLFDPADQGAIADALRRLWTDEALRKELAERGTRRVAGLTWGSVARRYRALYRLAAGRRLEDGDLTALGEAR
jgi:glycosyltransferase involved in cell wall biosynthesis